MTWDMLTVLWVSLSLKVTLEPADSSEPTYQYAVGACECR